jgi:hypothetical protein
MINLLKDDNTTQYKIEVRSRLTFGCRVSTEETSLWVCLEYGESGFVDDTFH